MMKRIKFPGAVNSAAWAIASAIDSIIPHYCLLCGGRIEEETSAAVPICSHCREGFAKIGGERCAICGRELFSEQECCYTCRGADHACSEVYPLFRYAGAPGALLKKYKSGKRASLASLWATFMMQVLEERWPDITIVPVPPRPEKLKRKEWDQVEAIVTIIEKNGYRVERILQRSASLQQKRLNRAMRKANAGKAYSLIPGVLDSLPPELLLIDDVYTTGATIEACARALLDGGAKSVAALVLAAD